MISAIFVAPFLLETTVRFIRGATQLPGVRLALISQESVDKLPQDVRDGIAAFGRVQNGLDAEQLVDAVRLLGTQIGEPRRLLGALEQLQVPLAVVRQRLGLAGMSIEVAENFRDKARMKNVLRERGLPCARHCLISEPRSAVGFVEDVGFPIVVKPPAGAGALGTFRLDNAAELSEYLDRYPPGAARQTLLEEFLTGEEHSFDSVVCQGRPVWYSISRYLPSPLAVMENPWIQWSVLLPKEIDTPEFLDIRDSAWHALQALGIETGLTHMEWFRRPDGSLAISEVAARPPGAQITSLISYACDHDFYLSWPRLMILDEFEPPERRYAVGAAYLRGMGHGRVKRIHGLENAHRELRQLVVEAKLPSRGQMQPSGYEGAGYIILRHPETSVVAEGLRRAVELIRVELG